MRKAFSLVELLIVVTIISVLTGAALPFVGEYLESARAAKAQNDLDEFSRAINAYEAQTGREYNDTSGDSLVGRYIQKIPLDPWGSVYSFASATDSNGATVVSAGPDRTLGNDDDIVVGYKGKLAVVSAKWFDANGDGRISISSTSYPATDVLIVRFNRIATSTAASYRNLGAWYIENGANTENSDLLDVGGLGTIASVTRSTDGRQYTFQIQDVTDPFVLGVSFFKIKDTTLITDAQGVPAVSASATILAR